MVASRAQRLILGSAASELELLVTDLQVDRRPYADPFPDIAGRLRIVHEFERQRCRAVIHRRPAEIVEFPLDFGAGDSVGWEPPAVLLPTNLPEFPSGLSLEHSSIWLRFTDAPGFTQPPYWPGFEPA